MGNTKTAKKANHLEVVQSRKEEWEAILAERDRHTLTEMQLDSVFGELIETADQFFIESVFNFRNNLKATEGLWGDHPYLEEFVEKLNPYLKHLENKLRTALPDRYPGTIGEPDADLTSMISDREECAYIIGVFLGAELAGASNEKLNALRRNLVL